MTHQNFEQYADEKIFNYTVPERFKKYFDICIKKTDKPLKNIRILDFGCGDGKHYRFFIESGLLPDNVFGVEVSKKRIARCRDIGWKNSYFITNRTLPFSENEFDIINLAEVIEHIPSESAREILSDLTRILKKDGHLIITTPNYPIKRLYDILDAFIGGKWKRLKDDPTHVSPYNIKKLGIILKKYFNSVEVFPYKDGFLYNRIKKDFFLHKMIAVCTNKK